MDGAVDTVIATIQLGVPVARMELMDETQMDAVNRYSKTSYAVAPTLFFEFHSDSAAHVADQAKTVEALAAERGGHDFQWATRLEDREQLWRARHDTLYAALALRPGRARMDHRRLRPDLASRRVHPRNEAGQRRRSVSDLRSSATPATEISTCIFILDLEQPGRARRRAAAERSAGACGRSRLGGTCTGEHGVGIGKMKYLEAEHGSALEIMRTLKRALDPDNRMNPGKMVDP